MLGSGKTEIPKIQSEQCKNLQKQASVEFTEHGISLLSDYYSIVLWKLYIRNRILEIFLEKKCPTRRTLNPPSPQNPYSGTIFSSASYHQFQFLTLPYSYLIGDEMDSVQETIRKSKPYFKYLYV